MVRNGWERHLSVSRADLGRFRPKRFRDTDQTDDSSVSRQQNKIKKISPADLRFLEVYFAFLRAGFEFLGLSLGDGESKISLSIFVYLEYSSHLCTKL